MGLLILHGSNVLNASIPFMVAFSVSKFHSGAKCKITNSFVMYSLVLLGLVIHYGGS